MGALEDWHPPGPKLRGLYDLEEYSTRFFKTRQHLCTMGAPVKRGTPDHPKVFDLCDRLVCDRPTALGYLELLWHFTAKYAPQGNIGRFPDRRIEAALNWVTGRWKQNGQLIRALTESRWIDSH